MRYVNTFFETRERQLFDLADVVKKAFSAAGIDYQIGGGWATYLYVESAGPDAGRLTKDIDIVVRRGDLERIKAAVAAYGFEHRRTDGVELLAQANEPSARRAVHLMFAGEKVKADAVEPTPDLGKGPVLHGVPLVPLADLLRMKLTSFRLKDQTHIKDLQEAGLITPDIVEPLPPSLRERLEQVLRTP